jgi:plasmid maintenance system antidote protein VapI
MPADFWMGLQADYDRRMAENKLAVMLPQIRRYQAVA